jgi:GcrA cell cycle regulator
MRKGWLELVEPSRVVIPYIVTHEMWWVAARENRMEWTAKSIDLLRALWAEGHSTAEIGRRMGVTKNAIVGKAHRLDLPARPSPIRKLDATGATPAPRRKPAPTREAAPPAAAIGRAPPQPQPRPAPPLPIPSAPVASAQVSHFPRASLRSCCWPIGEPGQREFRFCAAEAAPGKPYCADHAAIAYVKVRDRRSDAA